MPRRSAQARRRGRARRSGGSEGINDTTHRTQGLRALAAILEQSLSGLPADQIARIDASIVERIFRQNISMGKGIGPMSMVEAVRALARAAARPTPPLPSLDDRA